MPDSTNALRKAAILIDSLDPRSADALLDQMGEAQAQRVRAAVLELDDVSPEERDEVIAAFMGGGARSVDDNAGVELDASLASKFGQAAPDDEVRPTGPGPQTDRETPPPQAAPEMVEQASPRPFAFLHEATPNSLASLLAREHPQTVALVVAHVSPDLAANVLRSLPGAMQVEVLRRVVDLEETEPEILREVERQMEAMLSDELRANRRRQAGLVAVGAILAAAGGEGRGQLLANLTAVDRSLAERFDEATEQTAVVPASRRWRNQLTAAEQAPSLEAAPRRRVFAWRRARVAEPEKSPAAPRTTAAAAEADPAAAPSKSGSESKSASPSIAAGKPRGAATAAPPASLEFEDLMQLDDRSLVVILNAADPELTLLALTGAPDQLIHRIARQLPRSEAQALRRRTQQTGPLRLSDIEEARRQLARLAAQLVGQGEIRLAGPRRFAVAV